MDKIFKEPWLLRTSLLECSGGAHSIHPIPLAARIISPCDPQGSADAQN